MRRRSETTDDADVEEGTEKISNTSIFAVADKKPHDIVSRKWAITLQKLSYNPLNSTAIWFNNSGW